MPTAKKKMEYREQGQLQAIDWYGLLQKREHFYATAEERHNHGGKIAAADEITCF